MKGRIEKQQGKGEERKRRKDNIKTVGRQERKQEDGKKEMAGRQEGNMEG